MLFRSNERKKVNDTLSFGTSAVFEIGDSTSKFGFYFAKRVMQSYVTFHSAVSNIVISAGVILAAVVGYRNNGGTQFSLILIAHFSSCVGYMVGDWVF